MVVFFLSPFFLVSYSKSSSSNAFRVSLGYPVLYASQTAVQSGLNIWSIVSKVCGFGLESWSHPHRTP